MSNTRSPLLPSDDPSRSDLRRQAEKKAALLPDNDKCLSLNETMLMLHELRVHQIELEMQNEELRLAQVEVDAARRRYFDLYDLAPVGYLTLSEMSVIQEVNLNASTLLGMIRSALVSYPISKFILKEDQGTYYRFHKQLFATGEPQTYELRMMKRRGMPFWAQLSATVVRNADGTQVCRIVLVDMTERKRVEESLLASEVQLNGILESAADGILAVDNEGRVIKANSRFAELWRVPASILKGGDDNALLAFVQGQLLESEAFLKKVQLLYTSDAADMETLAFKDGRVFERYSIPMLMNGRVLGRVWSFRDITVRKQTEEAVINLAKAKSKFTSVVSHELRSPLATIKEATNLVLEEVLGPVNDEQKDMLETAKKNIERLGRLVNNVLIYQTMEAEKTEYQFLKQDINEVVNEAEKDTLLFAGNRKEDIVMDLGAHLPNIEFDKDKIMQVLMNLLSNAINYSERGLIVIQTRLKNSEIRISVQDSGQGVSQENLDEIFMPFSQRRGKVKGGTGLGLAIAKDIVLAHHGNIWVESEEGKGSTFYFTLPC